MGATWREMDEADLAAVKRLADRIHPQLPEGEAMFRDRLRLFPAGCLVLSVDGRIAGYAVSHPWIEDAPPPLDTVLGRLPDAPDSFYLHDVAIAPDLRGKGFAPAAVARLLECAAAFPSACLVSVYGTAGFWSRFGFEERALRPGKLAGYGEGARYMVRRAAFAPASCAIVSRD